MWQRTCFDSMAWMSVDVSSGSRSENRKEFYL